MRATAREGGGRASPTVSVKVEAGVTGVASKDALTVKTQVNIVVMMGLLLLMRGLFTCVPSGYVAGRCLVYREFSHRSFVDKQEVLCRSDHSISPLVDDNLRRIPVEQLLAVKGRAPLNPTRRLFISTGNTAILTRWRQSEACDDTFSSALSNPFVEPTS